ncbi:uncharacterized protein PODANS_2_11595 [Podospora anserina S mat+]|uniref:Podospora anserina S mat+ genomic DNA chromosome 2, supercontig 2 n=1 Tax=Podospora anserina (strain S / ATCC MYA-4624 / DSM 980 / FGSC 10383) TaxID=515849 RepID=B2B7M4_PODAN|nr:uncharacterized protein PODANS_2_11595 [Podospora anserina S mat+]CAP73802.1 unnamed protein product [Podospora anserina S mat+]CDP26203.1 Putative protein of unknown function [Podospora anserina S mat+]
MMESKSEWIGTDGLYSASLLSCDPPEPTFTREWVVNFIAADASSSWDAAYTIMQEFTGDANLWSVPESGIPPNFVQTAVKCAGCAEPTVTITCPNVLGTEAAVVVGNGVWATVAPEAEVEAGAAVNGEPGRVAAVSRGEWEGDGDWELVASGEGPDFGLSGSLLGESGDGNGEEAVVEGGGASAAGVAAAPAGVNVPTGTEEKVAFATAGAGSLTLKRGLMWGLALGLVAFF